MKDKQISIPEPLFLDIVRYVTLDNPDPEIFQRIRTGVLDKLDRVIAHDLYSKYKTAKTEAEREAARKEYAKLKGIPENFRW